MKGEKKMQTTYEDFLGVLDYLQGQGDVFVSGHDGRPTHRDAYMTIVDPAALSRAIDSSDIPEDLWIDTAEFLKLAPNGSPTVVFTASLIKLFLEAKRQQ